MDELIAYRKELLTALESVAGELSKAVATWTGDRRNRPIDPYENSPHYILFHLRELELKVFSSQLPRFLAEENPVLPAFDDQVWMHQHYRSNEPASAILAELASLRHKELAWLRTCSPAEWSRLARHPWWGVHTLQWWVELQLDWSYQHLRQLGIADKM